MESESYKNVIRDIIVDLEKVIHIAEKILHEVVMIIIENSLVHGKRCNPIIQSVDNSNKK